MALSAAQMEAFERDGAVLVTSPLTPAELDGAEAAWDRISAGETTTSTDEDYLDMLTHPYWEQVATQVLRAEGCGVGVLETYPHNRAPNEFDPDEDRDERDYKSWNGGHLDVQITRAGWEATPRREMLAIWLWCNDVPLERGPMRVLKGSHLPIADYWSSRITPEHERELPRVHGLSPAGRRGEDPEGSGGTHSGIPELMDVEFKEQVLLELLPLFLPPLFL